MVVAELSKLTIMEISCSSNFPFLQQPNCVRTTNHDKQGFKPAFPNLSPLIIRPTVLLSMSTVSSWKTAFGGSPKTKSTAKLIVLCKASDEDWTAEMVLDEDDDYEDSDGIEEPAEPQVGDGEEGGGVSLGSTYWGSKALTVAQEVILPFKDELEIFAFKATNSGNISVRLDKLSNKYGSPSIDDIRIFSSLYLEQLNEAKQAGVLPDNLALEVSSPGAERIVRVPQDLERFKDLPMYVRYLEETAESGSQEQDAIFQLDSVEMESGYSTWKLANVKLNRQLLGKGRALNKKQRQWRLRVPFASLLVVRLYLEI